MGKEVGESFKNGEGDGVPLKKFVPAHKNLDSYTWDVGDQYWAKVGEGLVQTGELFAY